MNQQITIQVTFLNPFRIIHWNKKENRQNSRIYKRGGTFAKWHKINESWGRPYITGTLVRSALLTELEKILIKHNPFKCCPGNDQTPENNKPEFLRKRPRYDFNNNKKCNEQNPCPLCLIKGEYDTSRRKDKINKENIKDTERWTVHFSNLFEATRVKNRRANFNWDEIAVKRIVNRVDPVSGKAKDYFEIYEISPGFCPKFEAAITLNTEHIEKNNGNIVHIKQLIAAGLAQIHILAGATCRIDIVSEEHDQLIKNFMAKESAPADPRDILPLPQDIPGIEKYFTDQLGKLDRLAEQIADIFGKEEKARKLRKVADVIRELRRESPGILTILLDTETKDNNISGKLPQKEKLMLWQLLEINTRAIRENPLWRAFCEQLGEAVYKISKKSVSHAQALPRLLGETEYYGLSPEKDDETYNVQIKTNTFPKFKWLITGQLKAETPFFFGAESSAEQTSMTIVLNHDGSFRLPRSVIRGALRRDLRLVIGDGCNMRIGGNICQCPVCLIMSRIIVEDSTASCFKPPEFRYRIRLNPHTRTVEEGALFDMETGYQGMVFPFRIYFETGSDKFDTSLFEVLKHWSAGKAVFGGDMSIGFGRFRLENISVFSWSVSDKKQQEYSLLNRCFTNMKPEEVGKIIPMKRLDDIQTEKLLIPLNQLPWKQIKYRLEIISPLISRDTIGAMFDPRNTDTIMIKKSVFISDGKGGNLPEPEKRYFIKSETIRGILRSILAGNKDNNGDYICDLDHEDCNCLQCRLFGSIHQQGSLRFEDAEIKGTVKEQKMDHVAIDRFTGGGVDKMKFDEYPLTASPDNPLVLEGCFWIRNDIEQDEKEAFENLLPDFRDGWVSLGGLDAIGYGQVGKFEITEGAEWIRIPEQRRYSGIKTGARYSSKIKSDKPLSKDRIYHPHYFLKPSDKKVKRERRLISHTRKEDADGNTLFTGKIICRLFTKGAIFIPDTDAGEDYFDMQKDYPEHKSLGFFRINGKPAIPGSSLRGMISSVYEALTNSCFRVFDQEKYITRRIQAEKEEKLDAYRPGRVVKRENGTFVIHEMGEIYRLPLYDVKDVKSFKSDKYNPKNYENRKYHRSIKNALVFNENMAGYVKKNRDFLKQYRDVEIEKILSGKEPIWFTIVEKPNPKNPADNKIVLFADEKTEGAEKGFVKFTGPCMVNVEKLSGKSHVKICNFTKGWAVENIWHNTIEERESQKKKYPRPVLKCVKDEFEYTMLKRCEHIFSESEKPVEYNVPDKVRNQYNDIIKDNRNNMEHVAPVFQSRLLHDKLDDNDLVYFKIDKGKVAEIVPVRISRKTDDTPMAKRFENKSLRPCNYICTDDCDECPRLCEDPNDYKNYFSPHPEGLCPACHLFGTTYYKGRVSCGIAWFDKSAESENPKWYMTEKNPDKGGRLTLPLLERPRPTWSMPDKTEMPDKEESKVPGRKFYIHHPWSAENLKNKPVDPNKNNRTVEPLDKGNEFLFELRFNNIRDWELGLMLYSLELEDNLAHKLGMGKAIGMGSVQIFCEEILLKECENQMDKSGFIQKGFEYLSKNFESTDIEKIRHIRQLRELLRFPENISDVNVRYPELKGKENIPGYTDFKEKEGNSYISPKDRIDILQMPWKSWY